MCEIATMMQDELRNKLAKEDTGKPGEFFFHFMVTCLHKYTCDVTLSDYKVKYSPVLYD